MKIKIQNVYIFLKKSIRTEYKIIELKKKPTRNYGGIISFQMQQTQCFFNAMFSKTTQCFQKKTPSVTGGAIQGVTEMQVQKLNHAYKN